LITPASAETISTFSSFLGESLRKAKETCHIKTPRNNETICENGGKSKNARN
jgi:hypothetical protein